MPKGIRLSLRCKSAAGQTARPSDRGSCEFASSLSSYAYDHDVDHRLLEVQRLSGTVQDKKRLFKVTAGNLRNHHIYINGHYDFFPKDCIGGPSKPAIAPMEIHLEGLNRTIQTDIGSDARTGVPRRFFRGRAWVREFFEHHKIRTGSVLALERLAPRRYRLYPFESKGNSEHNWQQLLETPLPGRGPTVLELFAGCGGMALGFKRAGFRTVLASKWDSPACDSLRSRLSDCMAQRAA